MVFERRGVDSIVGDSLRDSGASRLQLDWFVEVRSLCLILLIFADCYNTIYANIL